MSANHVRTQRAERGLTQLNTNDDQISYETCADNIKQTKEQRKQWYKLCQEISNGFWPKALNSCKSPCTTVQYAVKKVAGISNLKRSHVVKIGFNTKVSVEMEALKYGYFDVVVEIGSSLGLWLGLSALDLVAYKIHFYKKIKHIWKVIKI